MPPKPSNPGGLTNYIQQNGPSIKTGKKGHHAGPHDDLKVHFSETTEMANSVQVRRRPLEAAARYGARNAQHGPNSLSPFYDTETGSIDGPSPTPSIRDLGPTQDHNTDSNHRTLHAAPSPAHTESSDYGSGKEDDEVEDRSEGLPDDLLQQEGLSRSAIATMKALDAQRKACGVGSWAMQGDSYPSTTSGPPSPHEARTQNFETSSVDHDAAGKAPVPDRGQRQSLATRPLKQNLGPSQAPAQQVLYGQGPSLPFGAPLQRLDAQEPSVNGNQFEFETAGRQASRNARAPVRGEGKPQVFEDRAKPPHTRGDAQMKPSDIHKTNGYSGTSPASADANQQPQLEQASATGTFTPHVRPNPESVHPTSRIEQQQPTKSPQQLLVSTQSEREHQQPPPSKQPEQALGTSDSGEYEPQQPVHREQEAADLDYDRNKLIEMDYSALKSQSFDTAPGDQPISLEGVAQNDPINAQMTAVSNLDPQAQHEFLTSLAINEWEHAGDWFLDRFRETLTKLKTLREERRKVAYQFENEIESRHVAVNKKRTLTETALDDMKTSGKMVLDGTPQKNRKAK